uniref:Uncharacterized protein n=1 Tax=Cryptococcus bacillisporus CA1280 TaxID=1296109 RepID=A0A0D0VCM4_CRYGA|nr:hypothetical protein I312_05320 [Cryptococcus bacillisporus CA1280]
MNMMLQLKASPTALLLERLVDHAKQQDDMLALLAELLAKQTKQSAFKECHMPWGIPLPKATDIPCFQGPLSDADSVLTHLCSLQQLFQSHALLTPMDNEEMEEQQQGTVIEIANNSLQCAGLIGWVEHDGHLMEKESVTTWEDWSAAFKVKAMPSHWEFHESCISFHLSLHEVSPESWCKFDNDVILHCSHLYGTHLYPKDKQITDFYWAACPEHLFLCLVDKCKVQMRRPSLSDWRECVGTLGASLHSNSVEEHS